MSLRILHVDNYTERATLLSSLPASQSTCTSLLSSDKLLLIRLVGASQ